MLLVLIFVGIFAVAALVQLAVTARTARQNRRTLSRLKNIGRKDRDAAAALSLAPLRREEPLSALGWLDYLLQKADTGRRLQILLNQADVKWTAGGLVLTALGAAAATGLLVYWRVHALPPALGSAALAAWVPFFYVVRRRRKRLSRIQQYLPEALDLMVAALRAGHSLISALGMAAKESPEPLRRELRQCFDEQNFGLDLRTAFLNLAARVPIHEVRCLVTAFLIQKETGGNLTEILDKTAYLIREDFRLQRQVMIHTAQGRMTGKILSSLPLVLGCLLYLVQPDYISLLWRHPLGQKMLYAAGMMTLIGLLIIRRVVGVRV
jgi:tight adherence protein B